MSNRNIGVRNGLVDRKHYEEMGDAIWLYLWLVDHQTNSRGAVLGGKGLTYKEMMPEFGARTVRRWMRRLSAAGYIEVKYTDYKRLVLSIAKAKKFPQQQLPLETAKSGRYDRPEVADIAARSGRMCGQKWPIQPLLLKRETIKPEEKEENPPPVSLARDIPPTHPFAQIWQQEHGPLPGIEKLTPSRLRNCRLRERQYTPGQFREAVIRCRASPFLSGMNDRGWKANFDFLIRNDRNISRVLEGEFDGTAQTKSDRRLTGNLEAGQRFLERHGEANHRLAGAVRHALPGRPQ
jgi:hypothetical protein